MEQETVSGSGISWVICKSAPRSRQITGLATHHWVVVQAHTLTTSFQTVLYDSQRIAYLLPLLSQSTASCMTSEFQDFWKTLNDHLHFQGLQFAAFNLNYFQGPGSTLFQPPSSTTNYLSPLFLHFPCINCPVVRPVHARQFLLQDVFTSSSSFWAALPACRLEKIIRRKHLCLHVQVIRLKQTRIYGK